MILLLLILALCILTGLDLKITQMRWKLGATDLNPIVEHFRKYHGATVGLLMLAATNLLVLAAASLYQPLLWMLLGGKLSLAAIQLRSLNV